MDTEINNPPKKNKSRLYLIGGIALLVLLAAAAFLAGRLMNNGPAGWNPFGPGMFGGPGMQAVGIELERAEELPSTSPEVSGLYSRREGNSLFVSPIKETIGVSSSSSVQASGSGGAVTIQGTGPESDGPVVEVVITHDTVLYRDATEFPSDLSGSVKIRQVVEPGSLEDLNDQSMVSVWGRKIGDRVIADLIFYTKPVMIKNER